MSKLLMELSEANVVQRLKGITLSSVPPWLGPSVSTATRYQHSIAVGKLSILVSGGSQHDYLLLAAASILHDIGNGPFPHISDHVMKEILGFNHEGAIKHTLMNYSSETLSILERYNLSSDEIAVVIEKKHKISSFLYGFPDLDNTDNIYRFIMNIPGRPLGKASYKPFEIASSMSLNNDRQIIPKHLLDRWKTDYSKVYTYLWNNTVNMVVWTMLGRALRLLKEDLNPIFFRLTNKKAFEFMSNKLPKLIELLVKKKYRIIYDKRFKEIRGDAKKLKDPSNLSNYEERIHKEIKIDPCSFGLTVDQPLIGEKPNHWRVYVVTDKENNKLLSFIEDIFRTSYPLE